MAYIKPTANRSTAGGPIASSDSDYLFVDGKDPQFEAKMYATQTGIGVKDSKGQIEIVDALPMSRSAVRTSMGWSDADSDLYLVNDSDNSDFAAAGMPYTNYKV